MLKVILAKIGISLFRYGNGKGVYLDGKQKIKWYIRAAMQGHADAQFNLILEYDIGEDVLKDHVEAYAWSLHLASNGRTDLKDVFAKALTSEQIAQGQVRALEIQEKMNKKTSFAN